MGGGRAPLQVAARQRGLAHRQLVHAARREGVGAVGAGGALGGRRDRMGGHAGGVRRARRGDAPAHRRALRAPLALSLAGQDRPRGRDGRRVRLSRQGGAAAPAREGASRHGPARPLHRPPRLSAFRASTRPSRSSSCPTSSTSPAGRRGRTRIGGSPATWSSGTTAACCTGRRPYDYGEVRVMRHTRVAGRSRHRARADAPRRARPRVRAVRLESVDARRRRRQRGGGSSPPTTSGPASALPPPRVALTRRAGPR